MSRHEGVSCDSCMKNSFTGRRYKCLRCCDYDLCSACFEAGLVTSRHKVDHAMQCLLTRADSDIYFGGEEPSSLTTHHSFTCPYCSRLGFTDVGLLEHVDEEHGDETKDVVCPVCAATPGSDPNHMTKDLLSHLTVEHRAPRSAMYDDTHGDGVHNMQRSGSQNLSTVERHAAVLASTRPAGRSQSQVNRTDVFISDSSSSTGSNGRDFETVDPVSELLSQLTNARNRAQAVRNVSAQLHQLELQLQSTRQQLEGLPLRSVLPSATSTLRSLTSGANKLVVLSNAPSSVMPSGSEDGTSTAGNIRLRAESKSFLLSRHEETNLSESELELCESARADRSLFVQELFLAAITCSSYLSPGAALDTSVDIENCVDNASNTAGAELLLAPPISVVGGSPVSPLSHKIISQKSPAATLEDGLPDGISANVFHDSHKDATADSSPLLFNSDADANTLARLMPNKTVRETLK